MFGMLCFFETPVLRFALFPYYRRYLMFRYNEVCEYEYDFNTNDMNSQTLHFTQVVWKKTTKLGMGYAKGTKDGMTCYYAVGRYREAGNMMGDFKTSVPKGLN